MTWVFLVCLVWSDGELSCTPLSFPTWASCDAARSIVVAALRDAEDQHRVGACALRRST